MRQNNRLWEILFVGMFCMVGMWLMLGRPCFVEAASGETNPLKQIQNWMYQIQNIEWDGRLAELVQSPYDLFLPILILEKPNPIGHTGRIPGRLLRAGRKETLILSLPQIQMAGRKTIRWPGGTRAGMILSLREKRAF